MSAAVLDASALLAWLWDEAGAGAVDPVLPDVVMSSVNWAEVGQKLAHRGSDPGVTLDRLVVLGVTVVSFGPADAVATAGLWPSTRAAGLSLADRACLALARARALPALTADRAWSEVDAGVEVRLVR